MLAALLLSFAVIFVAEMGDKTQLVAMMFALLSENGAHGVVGNWVRARAIGVLNGVDYKHTGRVEKVDVQLLRNLPELALGCTSHPIMLAFRSNRNTSASTCSSADASQACAQSINSSSVSSCTYSNTAEWPGSSPWSRIERTIPRTRSRVPSD